VEKIPPMTPGKTQLFGRDFWFVDGANYCWAKWEIFKNEIYRFELKRPDPLIIDVGANLGMSVIYFKRLYPQARITAFEAHPALFEVLQKNLRSFGCEDVQLHAKAVWKEEGNVTFLDKPNGCAHVEEFADSQGITVPAVRLSSYLQGPVDVLKIDIEGAEMEVLRECESCLNNVQVLFLEYHCPLHQRSELPELLQMLERNGFYHSLNEAKGSYQGACLKTGSRTLTYAVDLAAWRR
jgi:FkbM family methyltransferase